MRFVHSLATGTLILLLAATVAVADSPHPALDNLDFEQGDLGSVPPGWFVPPTVAAKGYAARLVDQAPAAGKRAAVITFEGVEPGPSDFGNLMKSFEATAYRGKRIRLTAAVRVEVEGTSRGQMWLRVDRQGRQLGFFDNMTDRPITAPEWRHYDIEGDIAADAERINFGMMLIGEGKVWLDSVAFEVVGEADPVGAADLDNLDFEAGVPGRLPASWFAPRFALQEGYVARTVEGEAAQGERSALIAYQGGQGDPKVFGNLMRAIDASPYLGKRVRLAAAVKAEGRAQLWLRVDRDHGQMGFFDNMADRPITDAQWRRYEIVGEVAEDATHVNFGLMLIGGGQTWLDDVSLEILGDSDIGLEAPRPLTERGLVNLVAFTRLLGYVRYFHPSDQAAQADWDQVALAGALRVENAASPQELADRLDEIFRPLAPTVQIFAADSPPSPPPPSPTPRAADGETWRVAWYHLGLGGGPGETIYQSRRIEDREPLPEDQEGIFADLERPFEASLGGGVEARIPLCVEADSGGTWPRATGGIPHAGKPEGFAFSADDRATRLAAVTLAWNVFQHFYPYFDVVESDWPAVLEKTLRSAATDSDAKAFHGSLSRLVAALHDGHGSVYHPAGSRGSALPVRWDWIESQLVVTAVDPSIADQIRPGDAVRSVDGRPAAEALSALEEQISGATAQWRRRMAVRLLASGALGERMTLDVESLGGERRKVELQIAAGAYGAGVLHEKRPGKIVEMAPGYFYLDLSQITDGEFEGAVEKLAEAEGLVFDLRGYPVKLSTVILAHLSAERLSSARWNVPVLSRPDRQGMTFAASNWWIEPRQPRLTAPAVFLIDGRAISYAETYLGIVEHYSLADLVGTATAGTNGNVNQFRLPGGYRVSWTGMKVLKHDGSRHHGVGIVPTVTSAPTRRGVAEGRDEVLERALEVLGAPSTSGPER